MKAKILFSTAILAAILITSCTGRSYETNLKTELDSISYAMGITFGTSLQDIEMDTMNIEALASALYDLFNEKEVKITREEAHNYLNNYFMMKQFGSVKQEGEDFLRENKTREGVVTLPSGLQYEVLIEGTGPIPTATDIVKAHYHGTLIDGSVFDSSIDRGEPLQIQVSNVILGWQEALQLMPTGSKWRLFIPQELAYGASPRSGGPILPYSALIFEVELLEIIPQPQH